MPAEFIIISNTMKNVKNNASLLLSLILFPVFVFGVILSDFIWARLVSRDRKAGLIRLFETPRHSTQAGGSSTTSGDCFPAGTRVAVARFLGRYLTRAIEAIKPGDRVLAMDFPSGKMRRLTVLERIKWDLPGHPLVEIKTESGTRIVSTSIHPFVIDEENRTCQAWKLKPGDKILVLDSEKRWERIKEMRSFESSQPVYNLELVGGPHNYFASSDGLRFALVHNAKKDGDDTSGATTSDCADCTGCGCFRAGTLVATRFIADGKFESKPIENIKPGEEVLAIEPAPEGGHIVSRKTIKLSVHSRQRWHSVELVTESGAKIIATDNHPMVADKTNKTIRAGDILPGVKLVVAASSPSWERVKEVRKFLDEAEVYNIELDKEPHNYLVSADGERFLLAHNKD
jgi:hypothetical protein